MPATRTRNAKARAPEFPRRASSAEVKKSPFTFGKQPILVAFVLAIVTLAVYSPVLQCQFVNYDDNHYVTENVHVRSGLAGSTLRWALTSTEQANWHPLTWLSHALDYQLFGLNPAAHHATSALIHAVNVALLFLILWGGTGAMGRSTLVAGLFALHPFNVESVAWVAERKNVLCTLFFLLALGAYGWYSRKPSKRRYFVVAVLFALGLASKPMVITLPFVLLLADFWPLRRIQGWTTNSASIDQATFGKLVLEKIPLFALSAASAIITIHAQRSGGAMPSTQILPFGMRLANGIHSYAAYLWKTSWPIHFAPFYPGAPLQYWQIGLSASFLILVSATAWRWRNSHPDFLFGWLWYLGTMFPVLGLVQVGGQAMADRYTYIPLIGIFIASVWGASDIADKMRISPSVRAIAASVVLTALAFLTVRQISYWQTSVELWSHALQVTDNNLVAEDNLGVALLALGDNDDALPHFQNAARINPLDALSHINIGADYQEHQQWTEALAEYTKAVHSTNDPSLLVLTFNNLGSVYRQLGYFSNAEESYRQALRINPQDSAAFLALGVLSRERRVQDLKLSLEKDPNADGYLKLGKLLQEAGRTNDARDAYTRSVALGDKSGEARKALAGLQLRDK